jgi:hypothetical protein
MTGVLNAWRAAKLASEMIHSNGKREVVVPANGKHWTLRELQAKVGGYIEIVRTHDGRWLVVNELGKLNQLPPNPAATELYIFNEVDGIVGNVVVVDTRYELDGPEEDGE